MGYKTICKKCGKRKPTTKKGFCVDCSMIPMKKAIIDMRKKKGKTYKKWAKNLKQGLDKPKRAKISPANESKTLKRNLVRVKAKPLNLVGCPSCFAVNKATAKKCLICRIRFI